MIHDSSNPPKLEFLLQEDTDYSTRNEDSSEIAAGDREMGIKCKTFTHYAVKIHLAKRSDSVLNCKLLVF